MHLSISSAYRRHHHDARDLRVTRPRVMIFRLFTASQEKKQLRNFRAKQQRVSLRRLPTAHLCASAPMSSPTMSAEPRSPQPSACTLALLLTPRTIATTLPCVGSLPVPAMLVLWSRANLQRHFGCSIAHTMRARPALRFPRSDTRSRCGITNGYGGDKRTIRLPGRYRQQAEKR
jgi:hypothetical protein